MRGILFRLAINALALLAASATVRGIEVHGVASALGAALILGLFNAVLRPVLIILTLPFTLLTFGLFLLVINGLLLKLVSLVVKGFAVHGFWAAVFGALVVSVASALLNFFISDRGRVEVVVFRR